MVSEPARWFEQAREDLDTAEFNLGGARYPYAAFLCHQAAEKALKAVYIEERDELWQVHDLVRLAEEVDAPARVVEAGDILNPFYLWTRYPGGVDVEVEEEDALEALGQAREVLAWAEKRI